MPASLKGKSSSSLERGLSLSEQIRLPLAKQQVPQCSQNGTKVVILILQIDERGRGYVATAVGLSTPEQIKSATIIKLLHAVFANALAY